MSGLLALILLVNVRCRYRRVDVRGLSLNINIICMHVSIVLYMAQSFPKRNTRETARDARNNEPMHM